MIWSRTTKECPIQQLIFRDQKTQPTEFVTHNEIWTRIGGNCRVVGKSVFAQPSRRRGGWGGKDEQEGAT